MSNWWEEDPVVGEEQKAPTANWWEDDPVEATASPEPVAPEAPTVGQSLRRGLLRVGRSADAFAERTAGNTVLPTADSKPINIRFLDDEGNQLGEDRRVVHDGETYVPAPADREPSRLTNFIRDELEAIPQDPTLIEAVDAANQAEGFVGSAGAFLKAIADSDRPGAFVANMLAEQAAPLATSAFTTKGLGPLFQGAGKAAQAARLGAGGAAGSAATTYGIRVDEGLDMGLSLEEAEARAGKMAESQAAVDGAIMGLLPVKFGNVTTNAAVQGAAQMAGGVVGEAVAQVEGGADELDKGELVAEGLLELIGAPVEATIAVADRVANTVKADLPTTETEIEQTSESVADEAEQLLEEVTEPDAEITADETQTQSEDVLVAETEDEIEIEEAAPAPERVSIEDLVADIQRDVNEAKPEDVTFDEDIKKFRDPTLPELQSEFEEAAEGPASPAQQADSEYRASLEELRAAGVTDEQIKVAAEKFSPNIERDAVLGMYKQEQKVPQAQRTLDYVKETGETAFYTESDFVNIGGENAEFGAGGTDALMNAKGRILQEEVGKAGGKAVFIRKGGDEVGTFITGTDRQSLEDALARADERVANEIAVPNKITDLVNPKGGAGVGFVHGISEITPDSDLSTVFKPAEEQVELAKKEGRKLAADTKKASAISQIALSERERPATISSPLKFEKTDDAKPSEVENLAAAATAAQVKRERGTKTPTVRSEQLRQAEQRLEQNKVTSEAAIRAAKPHNKLTKLVNRLFTSEKGAGAFNRSKDITLRESRPLVAALQRSKGLRNVVPALESGHKRKVSDMIDSRDLTQEQREQITDYLEVADAKAPEFLKKDRELLKFIDEDVKTAIRDREGYLKAVGVLSDQTALREGQDMLGQIVEQMDDSTRAGYLHREYGMFAHEGDGREWLNYVKTARPELYAEIQEWYKSGDAGAASYLGSADSGSLDGALIELYKNSRNWSLGMRGDLTREGTSELNKRKDIPEIVRRYWGEDRDPVTTAARTLAGQERLMMQHEVSTGIAEELVKSGEAGYGNDKAELGWIELKPGVSKTHPYYGLYVEPDLYQVLKDYEGEIQAGLVETTDQNLLDRRKVREGDNQATRAAKAIGRFNAQFGSSALAQASSFYKANVVLANPGSHAKNWISVPILTKANGTRFKYLGEAAKAAELLKRHRQALQDPKGFRESGKTPLTQDEELEVQMLMEFDVVDESALGEEAIRSYNRSVNADVEQALDKQVKEQGAFSRGYNKLAEWFQTPDTIGRVSTFYQMRDVLVESGIFEEKGIPPESIEKVVNEEAALLARNMYPTYSNVMIGLSALRNKPFGAFFSWTNEVVRTYLQNFNIAQKFIRSGNTTLRNHGLRMMMYNSTVPIFAGSLAKAGMEALTAALGIAPDEEEWNEEVYSHFAPRWQANHEILAYKDKDGKVRTVDVSATLPYSLQGSFFRMMSDIIATEGDERSLDVAGKTIYNELLSPVIGKGLGIELASNLANFLDPEATKQEREDAKKGLQNALPGIVRVARNFDKDPEKAITQALGVTSNQLDWGSSAYWKRLEVNEARTFNRKQAIQGLDEASTEQEYVNILFDYYNQERSYQEQLYTLGNKLREVGIEDEEIADMLGRSSKGQYYGVGKKAMLSILDGYVVMKPLKVDYMDWDEDKMDLVKELAEDISFDLGD